MARDIPALQHFFDANPEYFHSVSGQAPRLQEAQTEFDELPPPGMSFEKKWLLGVVDAKGDMQAMANVLSHFLAPHVFHIGLFIVASSLHGTGVSRAIYDELERWMVSLGAHWVRLGVVKGNAKAERFWARLGYEEVRERAGIEMGERINTVRVMVKALFPALRRLDYLERVPRDQPGAE
ncbi:MAG TPA: GNAT family N-acetyltransferase [Casimicrobiaceae bacterium]|nr:GNAT family N-acetyltransferase [Casimicrobiaceae bacterium]